MKPSLSRLCAKANEPISRGLEILDASDEAICIVIDDNGRILGTVTDGDCRRALLSGHTLNTPIIKAAHTNFIAVDESFPLEQVYALMRTNSVRQVPVVDDHHRLIDLVLEQSLKTTEQQAQVLLLAGGKGTRLLPLTENTPKPMLHIGGKPMLARLIASLVESGLTELHISTSYLASKIEDYFGDGSKVGCSIKYLREETELGTAGPLKLMPSESKKPILVVNGDLVTTVNFGAMIDFHNNSDFDVTIGATNHTVEVPFGVLNLDASGKLRSIQEKPVYSFPVSAGIYIIEPTVVSLVPANTPCSMPNLIERAVSSSFSVGACPIHERWLDVGVPQQYIFAQGET